MTTNRKGILLAGGQGTRLWPMTQVISKQLLPVYDKPLVYYPLSTLMMTGIKEILLISTPESIGLFEKLLGDGSKWGLSLTYIAQKKPEGIAQAFLLGEEFIGNDPVCLILGDNIFFGSDMPMMLQNISEKTTQNTIFGYWVNEPEAFGIVNLDKNRMPVSLEEKPKNPKSNWAIPGLYFYGPDVVDVAKTIKPSVRDELEITDINQHYFERGELKVELIGRGIAWLDSGSPEGLIEAAEYVRIMEKRTGLKVCCPEEIAYRMGFIDRAQFEDLCISLNLKNTNYGAGLMRLLEEG